MLENNETVAQAKYMIAIATNSMTEEIRNNYFSLININRENCLEIFDKITMSVLRGIEINYLTAEEAKNIIETEFNNSCLHLVIGDYIEFSSVINKIIDTKIIYKEQENLHWDWNLIKSYIDIADTLSNDSLVFEIYYFILKKLNYGNRVLNDMDFSQKLINYLNSNSNVQEKILYDSLSNVIFV